MNSQFFFGVILGIIIGGMSISYDDALKEQELYCKMVAEGSWPDYKSMKDKCPGGQSK